jgi:hypothetical protein
MSERVTHRCADEAEAIGETTNPNGSIGAITTVRLWRRVGSIPTTGNLVIYEDCVVFATVGPREVGWLSRIVGGSAHTRSRPGPGLEIRAESPLTASAMTFQCRPPSREYWTVDVSWSPSAS